MINLRGLRLVYLKTTNEIRDFHLHGKSLYSGTPSRGAALQPTPEPPRDLCSVLNPWDKRRRWGYMLAQLLDVIWTCDFIELYQLPTITSLLLRLLAVSVRRCSKSLKTTAESKGVQSSCFWGARTSFSETLPEDFVSHLILKSHEKIQNWLKKNVKQFNRILESLISAHAST